MHHFQQKDYSHLVDLLNIATRDTLSEITRDESTRLLWNVLRRQPRLALLGLRGLLLGRNRHANVSASGESNHEPLAVKGPRFPCSR